ncbi:BTB/POZ domain-containing protein 6-like [Rhipicephalus sanguineus]|uniref:BTB/POZ domain-containing protein 6-like n=1 Tax=Rhipicephalus sanguineus TaxID=34632 RepID=UPI001893037B|nr:BTB/POZ domain-containing protein 6-like [Rhipicephalus sanguineus]
MSAEVFSLSECLDSGDLADVEILVNSSHFPGTKATFKAHKMILAVQNEVFRAMFYGDFAKEDRVVITDLHPEGVRGLLRYFYSGRLDVANVHQAACTRTAAAKYLVPKLEERCLSFVEDYMSLDDVCPVLDYVLTMGEENLLDHASVLISQDSLGVLSSSRFPLSIELTVRFILSHATNLPEVSVVNAVYKWAHNEALSRGTASDQQPDVRPFMVPLFPELRFLALTPKEFVEGPLVWKVFTTDEALAILSNIVKGGSMIMPKGFCQIREARVLTPKETLDTEWTVCKKANRRNRRR